MSGIFKKLWRSEEAVCIRRTLIGLLAVNVTVAVVIMIICGQLMYSLIAGLCFSAILLPDYLMFSWDLLRIFRHMEDYSFYTTKLVEPRCGDLCRRAYFYVVLEDPEEGQFVAQTNPIFWTHTPGSRMHPLGAVCGPHEGDYIRKTVTVAYNKKTQQVILIR